MDLLRRVLDRELVCECTIFQIGLSQHMSELYLSPGIKMQMAILERQPHGVDIPHVPKLYSFLSFPHDLGILPKP